MLKAKRILMLLASFGLQACAVAYLSDDLPTDAVVRTHPIGAEPEEEIAPEAGAEAPAAEVVVDEAAVEGRPGIGVGSADPHYGDIASYIRRSKAVIVVPQLLKAGLIIGGEMGDAVVLSRLTDDNPKGEYFLTGIIAEAVQEEKLVRGSVRRMVEDEAIPNLAEHYRAGTFPTEMISRFAEMGLLGADYLTDWLTTGVADGEYDLVLTVP